jgi:BMFP domain-containing protein YqiC
MTQTSNRILDEFARLMTDAAGVARGVREEAETVFRSQAEKVLRDLDVVQREEFEAVREMAARAREENERLAARLAELESRLEGGGAPAARGKKAAASSPKRPARKPAVGSRGKADAKA